MTAFFLYGAGIYPKYNKKAKKRLILNTQAKNTITTQKVSSTTINLKKYAK